VTELSGQFGGYEAVANLLGQVRRRWQAVLLVRAALGWLGLLAGVLIVCCLSAGVWLLPAMVRGAMLAVVVFLAAGGPAVMIWRLLSAGRSDLHYARFAEQRAGLSDNALTNAVLLASDSTWGGWFAGRAIDECCRSARHVAAEQVVPLKLLKGRAVATLMISLAGIALALSIPQTMGQGLKSILSPRGHVARVGRWRIVDVQPGDATVIVGEPLAISAAVVGPPGATPQVNLVVVDGQGRRRMHEMHLEAQTGRAGFEIPAVQKAFDYYVQAGDAISERYRVAVRPRLLISGVDVLYRYPAYLHRADRFLADHAGPVEVPQGTQVQWSVRLATPAVGAELVLASGVRVPMNRQAAGMIFSGSFTPQKDDHYAILITDITARQVHRLPGPVADEAADAAWVGQERYWPIKVLVDRYPTVRMVVPEGDVSVPLGGRLELVASASDDVGVGRLEMLCGGGSEAQLLKAWPGRGSKDLQGRFVFTFDAGRFSAGQKVSFWAAAVDVRDLGPERGPQRAESSVRTVTLVDPKQAQQQERELLEDLRERLRRLLKLQIATRADALRLGVQSRTTAFDQSLAKSIADRQGQVHDQVTELADDSRYGAGTEHLRRALKALAQQHTSQAAQMAGRLATLEVDAGETIAQRCQQLSQKQGRIIHVLQTLLEVADSEPASQPSTQPVGAEAPKAALLEEIHKNLSQFVEHQRQVLAESAKLADKPVEDYTETDNTLLDQLSEVEAHWANFLQKAVEDLDRLVDQDFSAATLRAELVEIVSDVQMAKDALDNKAVHMAVPAEQVGLELAQELLTQLERWLPDEPDRIKWELEEPPEPIDVPMADLPDELEDIIGELLEREEDLYDQIEDVTSSWADSLDAGAGWDAMDGPISNFSAKGVTGNVLPNASEIGGRSGEGRTGRTSGEMVEDTAVGKGGRRTPTRLTPDAFQAGRIRDLSDESAGGASGGGKVGGAAGEGLEGPTPQTLLPDLKPLAQKQAVLRSKAQKLKLQAVEAGYGDFALDQAIRLMRRNEIELGQGVYRNALRRRTVLLDSLEASSLLAGGKFALQADQAPALQKRKGQPLRWPDVTEFPPAFRQLLKDYYRTLSEGTQGR